MEPTDNPFAKLMEAPPFFDSWYTWIAIFIVAVLAGFRSYLRGPQYFSQTPLDDMVALVTGGNRGIGFFTAKELVQRGARVYIACRDSELGKEAAEQLMKMTGSKTVYYMPLRLDSLKDVRRFCSEFKKREQKLDILYCNAGVMVCPQSKTADGLEYHLGVNYIGHYVVVNELLPLLKAAAPSRIVIITSAAYSLGIIHYDDINQEKVEYGNGAECFSQSKLALMLMMNKLKRMLEDTEVTINACHPGVARTDIHRYMPIRTSNFLYVSTYPIGWYLMKSAADGAQTPIFMCIDESVKTFSGKYYVDMQDKPLEGLAGEEDEAEEDRFWLFTQQLIEASDKKNQSEQDEQNVSESDDENQGQGDEEDKKSK